MVTKIQRLDETNAEDIIWLKKEIIILQESHIKMQVKVYDEDKKNLVHLEGPKEFKLSDKIIYTAQVMTNETCCTTFVGKKVYDEFSKCHNRYKFLKEEDVKTFINEILREIKRKSYCLSGNDDCQCGAVVTQYNVKKIINQLTGDL